MASSRPWVIAGLLGGPSGRAALYAGDAEEMVSRRSSNTGVLIFLGGAHASPCMCLAWQEDHLPGSILCMYLRSQAHSGMSACEVSTEASRVLTMRGNSERLRAVALHLHPGSAAGPSPISKGCWRPRPIIRTAQRTAHFTCMRTGGYPWLRGPEVSHAQDILVRMDTTLVAAQARPHLTFRPLTTLACNIATLTKVFGSTPLCSNAWPTAVTVFALLFAFLTIADTSCHRLIARAAVSQCECRD